HPDIAGLASSIGGTVQMLTGGLMSALTGPFLDNSVLPMAAAISVCACLAWATAALSLPRLRLRFRGGSVCLNSFGRFAKWISASICCHHHRRQRIEVGPIRRLPVKG